MSVAVKPLEVDGLTKVFKRRNKPPLTAVDNLSFTIPQGQVVGLLGPNGAGKTTTIKCILGLIRATTGRIHICGHDVSSEYGRALEHASAVLEGARNIYWRLSVRENVRFFTGLHGLDYNQHHAHFDHLFERFGLNSVTEELVMNLSTGMKQKVAVVCALAKQTDLVFLDEPTLGLDIETSIELRKVLRDLARESGRTIVLSSHDMDVIQAVCERVIIIKDGRIIVDDSVDNLLALFSTRSYRVVLSGAAGESLLEQLAVLVPEVTLKPHGVNTELQFSLPSPQRLYDVIEVLRESGVLIETIGQRQPDLEEAFLHIIRGDRQQLAE